MRLHRFFTSETFGNRNELTVRSANLVNQLRNVFRLRVGDHIVLFNGSGSEHECVIASFVGDDGVALELAGSFPSRFMPAQKVFLNAAIVKKDNFEFIVEKATELGVTDIIPVMAERSEKKSLNEERLKKIAIEASEQSGRGDVPALHPIISLEESIALSKKGTKNLMAFHTEGEMFDQKSLSKDKPVALFIGPEGGWAPAELELFHKNGVAVRCLGPQVLRAETAVISALSVIIFGA